MSKLALFAIALTLFAQEARSQIATPHPRLILDSATLATLRARVAANTPQWQKLKSYCDSFIGGTVNYPAVNNDEDVGENDYPDRPDIGQGYHGDGYWSTVLAEGLCYQMTRSATDPNAGAQYAAKAIDILGKMATPYVANSATNTGENPCTDDGHALRFYGVAFGLGYDWVYDRLTTQQKSQIYTTADAWLTSFITPPPSPPQGDTGCSYFEYVVPDGNYFAGYFHAAAAIALATDGDNTEHTLWTDWQNKEFNTAASNPPHVGVQPYFAAHMTGGGWPEGFGNYGPLATLNMSLPAWEVKTAVGTDLIHAAAAYTYPVDAADYLMHFTWPSRSYIDDRDTNHANGIPTPPVGTADVGMFTQVLGNLRYWNAQHADVFQQYTNEVNAATSGDGGSEPWEQFLFWDPNGTTAPLSTLPLSYFATGLNAVAARSDWTTSASWMSFRAAPYIDNPGAGEEGFDQGSIALVRGSTPLLVNGTGQIVHEPNGSDDENRIYTDLYGNFDATPTMYTGNRQIYSVFFVRSLSGTTVNSRYGQAAYTAEDDNAQTHVAAFEDGSSYVLALATKLEDMYRPDSAGHPQVASWSREIIYLRPNRFLVYDRTTAGNATGGSTADDQFLAFDFAADPIAGIAPPGESLYNVTYNGTYAGAMTNVLPLESTVSIVGLYPPNDGDSGSSPVKVYQAQVRAPSPAAVQQWLTAFDTSTTSAAVAMASAITVTSGNAVGSVFGTTNGNQAVLFNSAAAGSTITGAITYTVPKGATTHFITELPPNSGYSVTVAVNFSNQGITVTPGGSLTTSAKGVLTFTVSAAGVVGPGDRIFADGFGG
jgi:hypothetical protein